MISDRKKIDEVLDFGETILSQRKELKDIPLNKILDALDDGTKEMMHNRWGVLAQVIINSITSWEPKELIEYLVQIDCPDLACEYVGYALQCTHGIVLEELLIEAADCGHFDKIVKYVSTNLQYKTALDLQFLSPFLQTLEQYREHRSYHSVLHYYAMGIASCDGFLEVVKQLNTIASEVQYHLVYNMRRYWFAQSSDDANAQIGVFLSQKSQWAWKAAIDYCEWNLPCDKFALAKYYPQIENLVNKYDEFKVHAIPLLVEYILQTAQEKELHPEYITIISKLRLLIKQVPSGVLTFLQKIAYLKDYPEDISQIFQDILSLPADNPTAILKHLDNCFLFLLEQKNYQSVIDDMFTFFSSNKYRANYLSFFDPLASAIQALSEYAAQITDLAIIYITSSNIDRLFFGLGLLVKLGNIKELYHSNVEKDSSYSGSYDDEQLIRVMKAMLFYAVDDDQICHIAFLLLYLAKGTSANYIQFCIDFVFFDYPIKMYEISKSYLNSDVPAQAELVNLVEESYASREALQKKARSIPDLYPSHEHQVIYHRAQHEQSRQISKRANELSVLNDLFSRRVLKYGRRSGHIIRDSKDQQFYQSSPYQEFRCEHHLPVTYVTDPVEYSTRRYDFLQEVKESASNN